MNQDLWGLGISKPVSVWNRPLSIEPKQFFLNLAKAAVNGTKLELDDAFENLMDALQASEVKDKAGQVAWVLIYRALIRSIADLVDDSSDLFELSEHMPDEETQFELSGMLNDSLSHCQARIDSDFFEHPERFGLLSDFEPSFKHWLMGLGLDTSQALTLAQRLRSRFTLALHEEWKDDPARFAIIREAIDTPFTNAAGRQRYWLQYAAWLRKQVDSRMFSESFSLQQVYVPLRAYYEKDTTTPRNVGAQKLDRRIHNDGVGNSHVVVDLHDFLSEWVMQFDPHDTVRVVSGGPGSGKSSFTRMFAADISRDLGIPVLHVPLHLLDPLADLIHAVHNFVGSNRYLIGSPLDAHEGKNRILVIFDGLDELGMRGRASAEVAQQFIEEVLSKSETFAAQNLKRQFLISGRELVIQSNSSRLRNPRQILHLLPFFVDDEEKMHCEDKENLLTCDQRNLWWQKYGRAIGADFKSMPAELRTQGLTDITRQPLLNYLIALSYRRKQLNFNRHTTLNEVYADLLAAVYERQWEIGRKHVGSGELEKEQFSRILEEIALTVWQGEGLVATVEDIHQNCESSNLVRYFDHFQEGAKKGVTRLLTAFYFRQAGDNKGEKTFEFTHKSFGEYLLSRRLIRMLSRIHKQLERRAEDPDDGWDERDALKHWAEICGPTAIDQYLVTFLQNEIALQRSEICSSWQRIICRLIESAVTFGMPMEQLDLPQFREMMRQSRNAEEALLVMHDACARHTEEVVNINWPAHTTFGEWIKRLQGPNHTGERSLALKSLNFLSLPNCELVCADLTGAALRGTDLCRAKLENISFWSADLQGASLENVILTRANLRGAKLRGANLAHSIMNFCDLEAADLREAQIEKTLMEDASLIITNLDGANLEGASLKRANLYCTRLRNANLEGANLQDANLKETDLMYSNLQGADLSSTNVDEAKLLGTNLKGANLMNTKLEGTS